MSVSLSRALIQLGLSVDSPHSSQRSHDVKAVLAGAAEPAWQESYETMWLHRLTPIVGYGLKKAGFTDCVPQPLLRGFLRAYEETRAENTVRLLTLDGILKKLTLTGITPTLWKGVVLADSFYPDTGMRMMGDIDFSVAPAELPAFTQVLATLGFTEKPEKATADAIYLENAIGMLCDVHHRVRLFEGKEDICIQGQLQPRHLKAPSITVLEPNAMLVHLIVHLQGHRSEIGPILLWMLDLAFVLREWGDRLECDRIQALLPDRASWVALLRTLRLLEAEWGEAIPPVLAAAAQTVQPYRLDDILRQCRLAQWGLPRPLGWLRLGASRFMTQRFKDFPQPHLADLLLWPKDLLLH